MRPDTFRHHAVHADPGSPRQMRQAGQIRMLGKLNRVLSWSCLGLAVVLVSSYFFTPRSVSNAVSAEPVRLAQPVRELVVSGPVTDGATVRVKDLFEPVSGTAPGVLTVDFVSQYKVVGIILDRHSQAVLKDRQTGKSFFVHKGDSFGGAQVAEIQEGKVVLSTEGQSWELRP